MNDEKGSKFLFSTQMKHKKIQIYKRKKEEEEGDVYEQLSRILEDGSDDLKIHDDARDDNKKHVHKQGQEDEHKINESQLFNKGLDNEQYFLHENHKIDEKFMESNDFVDQNIIVYDTHSKKTLSSSHHNADDKLHDIHKNNLTSKQQHNKGDHIKDTHNENKQTVLKHTGRSQVVNPDYYNEMSTVSLCTLLIERISKENNLIKTLENQIIDLTNSIKDKEEMHKNSEKFFDELKKTNCDLMHKNESIKLEGNKTVELFSKYKEDMTSIIKSLSDNINVCILENNKLSKDNYAMKTSIYLLNNIVKEDFVILENHNTIREDLDNYIEEISKLHKFKNNLKTQNLVITANLIIKIAQEIIEEEMDLVKLSIKAFEEIYREKNAFCKENENKITNYFLRIIKSMNTSLEECCHKIREEENKVEYVYSTLKNEIKRLKRKLKKKKNKTKSRKTSSGSDIWDVFK